MFSKNPAKKEAMTALMERSESRPTDEKILAAAKIIDDLIPDFSKRTIINSSEVVNALLDARNALYILGGENPPVSELTQRTV